MARPRQDGLLYFSLDTDFFYADKRIKRLHSKFGNDGLIFYIYMLTEIYRKGYYISWDEDAAEDAAADLLLKEGFIEQVLEYLRGRSLLTMSKLSTGVTIITSPGIQRRYQEAVKGRKRQIEVDSEIWLLKKEDTASCIKVTNNAGFSENNKSKSWNNKSKSENNNTKEKKVKESKAKETETEKAVQNIEEFLSAYPKECNRYLTEREYAMLILLGKATEDDLVKCANNYAEECRSLETPERYIKNAENFLKEFVFEKYLPGKYKKPVQKNPGQKKSNNFPQRSYDYEELERELLKQGMGIK